MVDDNVVLNDLKEKSFHVCFVAYKLYLGSHGEACGGGSDVQYRSSLHQICASPFFHPCSLSQHPTGLNEKNQTSASPARLWSGEQGGRKNTIRLLITAQKQIEISRLQASSIAH